MAARMSAKMIRLLAVLVCGAVFAVPASAQSRVQSLRLYVLDCGTIPNRDPERYNLKKEEVPTLTMAAACFLVVHPKGTLLYDTGLGDGENNPNRGPDFIPGPKSLKSQLTEIGHPPETVTYLALSHYHGDHTGNANDYGRSTWLVQKAEHEVMFPEKLPQSASTYIVLKDSKTILLSGDHDVFGDGDVVIKSTPGHSPGHQSLFVKLAKTGAVMLAGDLYHWMGEYTMNRLPRNDFNLQQTIASRKTLEDFMKKTGAQLWIPHDFPQNATLRKAPNYYE